MRHDASTALSYHPHTSMYTMHTIASSIANVVTGGQPQALASILATDTRHIRPPDNFVDLVTIRFAEDMPVARSPVLGKDRMVTIPIAGQARRVNAVHKTNYENGSLVFVRRTPNRPTTLRRSESSRRRMSVRRVVEKNDRSREA